MDAILPRAYLISVLPTIRVPAIVPAMLQAIKTFALSLGCGTLRSVKGRDDRVVSLPVRCGDAGVLLILSATDHLDRSNRTITTKARILGRFRPLRPGLRFTDRQEDIIFNNLPWDDERLRAALGLFLNPDGSPCKRAVINSLYHKDKPDPPETIDALWCALAEFAPALLARAPREAPLPPTFSLPKRRLAPGRHIPSSKLFSALRVDYGLPAPTSVEDAKTDPVHVQVGAAWLSLLLDREVTVTPKGAIDVMALLQATPSTEAAQAESARALTRVANGQDHAEDADSTALRPKASQPSRGKRSPATSSPSSAPATWRPGSASGSRWLGKTPRCRPSCALATLPPACASRPRTPSTSAPGRCSPRSSWKAAFAYRSRCP